MEEKYMLLALKEAKKAFKKGDVPVGAVIVKNSKIISKAYNQKENKSNAIKHAEIIAIDRACKKLKTWYLDECELYVTMEPCMMCCGAIEQSRIKRVIFAVENSKYGYHKQLKKVKFTKFIYKNEVLDLLKNFFANKR